MSIIRLNIAKKKIKNEIRERELRIFELKEIIADAETLIQKEQKKIEELHLSLCGTDFFSGFNTINFDKYDTLDLKNIETIIDKNIKILSPNFISDEKLS